VALLSQKTSFNLLHCVQIHVLLNYACVYVLLNLCNGSEIIQIPVYRQFISCVTRYAIFLVVAVFLFVPLGYATAGINQKINFQGKLVNSSGLNVSDGNYDVVFTLYDDPSAGSTIWTETWNSGTSQVSVTDGIFRVALGTHSSMASVDFNQDALYLGVKVGADSEMTPRIRFTSVPYAFVAKTVVDDALDFAQLKDQLNLDASTTITADNAEVFTISNTGTGNSFVVEDMANDTTPFVINSSGLVGIGDSSPDATLNILSTTEQLRLDYDDSNYASFTVNSSGDLAIDLFDASANRTLSIANSDATYTTSLSVEGDLTVSGGDLFLTPQASSSSTTKGTLYYDSDDDNLYVYANGGWVDLTVQGGASDWTLSGGVIYPTADTTDFVLGGASLASSIFSVDESAGVFLFGGDQSANPTLRFEATDSDTADFGFNTNDAFYFTGGYVGIGDTSPLASLDIGGGALTYVDGINDLLVADDIEIEDDLFVTDDVTIAGGSVTLSSATNFDLATNASALTFETDLLVLDTTNDGIDVTTGASTTDALDFTLGSLTTATGFDIDVNALTTGDAINVTSTSTGLTSGSLIDLYWNPSGTTTATSDLFKIDIGSSGVVGNLFALYDNGSDLFEVSQSQIKSALPHLFAASGDVSVAHDLLFTNQSASFIKSDGPLTLVSGEIYENLDLTLKAYGTGNIVLSGSGLELEAGEDIIFDSNDAGDTYMDFDSTNDRIRFYIDGTEEVRFQDATGDATNSITANRTISAGNDFDIAETYPTFDENLKAGELVMIDSEGSTNDISSLVKRAITNSGKSVLGVVSTSPGFTMGANSFFSDFCKDVRNSGVESVLRDYENSLIATESSTTSEEDFLIKSEIGAKVENKRKIAQACFAAKQVLVALSGRIPVLVDRQNGDIVAGDLLTVSKTDPGRAMKATGSGWIVAKALEDIKPGGDSVMAYVTSFWYEGDVTSLIRDTNVQVDQNKLSLAYFSDKLTEIDGVGAEVSVRLNAIEDIGIKLASESGQLVQSLASMSARLTQIENSFNSWQDILGASSDLAGSDINSDLSEASDSAYIVDNEFTTFDADILGTLTAGLIKIGGVSGNEINTNVGNLSVQSHGEYGIDFVGGKLTIDIYGNLETTGGVKSKKTTTGEIVIDSASSDASPVGQAIIPQGKSELIVENELVDENSKIFITVVSGNTGGSGISVTSKSQGRFVLKMGVLSDKDTFVDYLIVSVGE
jgi:hypothetical protein